MPSAEPTHSPPYTSGRTRAPPSRRTGCASAHSCHASEVATIGKSVVVKGELSGSEDLIVDGEVEGSITLRGQSLTVGPNGRVRANIEARNVIVHGRVDGNIHATERVDLRKSATLSGDIATARISIEDGAFFKGGIDIQKSEPGRRSKRSRKLRQPPFPAPAPITTQGTLLETKKAVSIRAHCTGCALAFAACSPSEDIDASAVSPYNGPLWPPASSKDYSAVAGKPADADIAPGEKISRKSTGFSEFIRGISREQELKILDLGSTSPANITFMTGLGHRFQQEDLLRLSNDKSLLIPNGDGGDTIDVDRFLRDNLSFERDEFDAVMFWDLADFLPETAGEAGDRAHPDCDEAGRHHAGVLPHQRCWSGGAVLSLQHRVEGYSGAAACPRLSPAARVQ